MPNSRRDAAYDFLKEFATAETLLKAIVNILPADDFISMAEDEFGFEEEIEEEEEEEEEEDATASEPYNDYEPPAPCPLCGDFEHIGLCSPWP